MTVDPAIEPPHVAVVHRDVLVAAAGDTGQLFQRAALQRREAFLFAVATHTNYQELIHGCGEVGFEGSGTVSTQAIGKHHHGCRCIGLAQDLFNQWQTVLGKLAGPGHDGGRDGGQVLFENLLVSGQSEHGMGAARIDDECSLFVRPQGQQIADFLLGSLQPAGLYISLLHGGRYIQQDHQGRFVLAQG